MKQLMRISLIVLVLMALNTAEASDPRLLYSVGGGLSVPRSPDTFTEFWKTGFTVGLGIGLKVNSYLTLMVNGDFNSFGVRMDKYLEENAIPSPEEFTPSGGSTNIINSDFDLMISPTPESWPLGIYLLGGIGYFRYSLEKTRLEYLNTGLVEYIAGRTDNGFHYQFGAGMKLRVGETTSFFVEVRYNISNSARDDFKYLPIRAGIYFNDFLLNE